MVSFFDRVGGFFGFIGGIQLQAILVAIVSGILIFGIVQHNRANSFEKEKESLEKENQKLITQIEEVKERFRIDITLTDDMTVTIRQDQAQQEQERQAFMDEFFDGINEDDFAMIDDLIPERRGEVPDLDLDEISQRFADQDVQEDAVEEDTSDKNTTSVPTTVSRVAEVQEAVRHASSLSNRPARIAAVRVHRLHDRMYGAYCRAARGGTDCPTGGNDTVVSSGNSPDAGSSDPGTRAVRTADLGSGGNTGSRSDPRSDLFSATG